MSPLERRSCCWRWPASRRRTPSACCCGDGSAWPRRSPSPTRSRRSWVSEDGTRRRPKGTRTSTASTAGTRRCRTGTTSTTSTTATGTPPTGATMTSTENACPNMPHGARPTRQRRAVATALQSFEDFRSAQEIHDLLRRSGDNVGLSTVYRTLQALADSGEVDMLRTEDGEAVYRRCSTTHHHHLVCRTCGRTVEVEGPAVEKWAEAVAGRHGFTDVSHSLEIFGTCPDC